MESWKTTAAGLIGALASISGLLGMNIPTEIQSAVVALSVAVLGIFAKDFNKT